MKLQHSRLVLLVVLSVVSLHFANGAVSGVDEKLETIHVVFMNHLDVGFDGIPGIGYAFNVINEYFNVYFPRAWNTSEWFIDHPNSEQDRYTWTTQPFLLYLYLHCSKFPSPWQYPAPGKLPNTPWPLKLNCPTQKDLERMQKVIRYNLSLYTFILDS